MDNILEMRGITKLYPGVVALNDVNFSLAKGEVHALVGENGAGKSTLIKVLAGATDYDHGTIEFDGKILGKYTPNDALNMGISVIYQEFNLVNNMSVCENIFFGREITKRGGKSKFLDKKAMLDRTAAVLESLDIDIDPKTEVQTLSVAYQQLAEIAKAIAYDAKVIVMDEPSATLTNNELDVLFTLIRKLKQKGTSIIYISHRMDEIFEIADTVTVFRDGTYIDTKKVSETTPGELVKMMVGRELSNTYPVNNACSEEIVLEGRDLYNKKVKHVSFKLQKGEILGISGLVGAGRTELARILFGADGYMGDILINGEVVKLRSPHDAIKHGIALLPEDRKSQGLVLRMEVDINTSMAALRYVSKNGWIDFDAEKSLVEEYVNAMKIKTPSLKQTVSHLSGGNQQKVILAKWLASKCDIIIFDEPTRGIDVGAKAEIYELMSELVKKGKSIIMISSELPELIGMSDRAYVMHEGHLVGELAKDELTQERLLLMASNLKGVIS